MAKTKKPIYYGELDKNAPFGTVKRTISTADSKRITAEIVGKFSRLREFDIFPGAEPPDVAMEFPDSHKDYRVENATLERDDGNTGVLTVTMIKAKGADKATNVTYDIEMQEVQKKLITHPALRDPRYKGAMEQIWGFENMSPELRVANWDKDGNPTDFYWLTVAGSQLPMTNKAAIAYAKAVTAGIETYNAYLPVISRTTTFLRMPGVEFDETTHEITGGELSLYSGLDVIGCYNTPPISIKGFSNEDEGRWFKSVDKYTQQANGSWTRNEQWVYTNDLRFGWIYGEK